jgi:chromosome segregation ATPase
MPKHSINRLVSALLAIFMIAGFLIVDSSAQKRRRRKRTSSAPRITNPAIYQPSPSDNTNSDGATETNSNSANSNNSETQPARTRPEDPEAMKKTIRTLSVQVDKLTDKINQMEESQRSLVDLERLSRAESRSAAMRAELRDVEAKEADLEARAEDVDYALKPENIERAAAGYGTTHPEEVREQRRKTLENEKQRIRRQLDQLAASRQHLEEAIATSDAEIDRLRKKMDETNEAAIQNAKAKGEVEAEAAPLPSPTPTPTPFPR